MAEAEILITMIREGARDNGTLFVSHLLFSKPAWDHKYFFVEKAPDPIPDQPPVQEQTPEKT